MSGPSLPIMAGEEEMSRAAAGGRCPRCEVCGRVVRVRGVGREGVWCAGCMGGALPFVGLLGEGAIFALNF